MIPFGKSKMTLFWSFAKQRSRSNLFVTLLSAMPALFILKELGTGVMLGLFQIGSLPHELVVKSANLFSTEVMPQVRAEVDRSLSYRLGATTLPQHQAQV